RARLTPRFGAPHLLVAAALFLAGVVGFSAFIVLRLHQIPTAGWPSMTVTMSGYLALVLLAAAVMAWSSHLQSPTFIFTMIAAGVTLISPIMRGLVGRVLDGRAPTVTYALIAGSAASLIALGW